MQEKTQFFCCLSQPIRKWIEGSFLFPVFPRRHSELSSLTPFPSSVDSSRKLGRVIAWQSMLSQLRMCVSIGALSHQTGAAPCQKATPLSKTTWCKGFADIPGSGTPWGSGGHWGRLLLGNATALNSITEEGRVGSENNIHVLQEWHTLRPLSHCDDISRWKLKGSSLTFTRERQIVLTIWQVVVVQNPKQEEQMTK